MHQLGRGIVGMLLASAIALGVPSPASARMAPQHLTLGTIRISEDPVKALGNAVEAARSDYTSAIATANVERRDALIVPRAERKLAMASATSRAERRLVRRAYDRAATPIRHQFAATVRTARTTRDAAIEAALATYLAATGRAELATFLTTYRDATTKARDTLSLALQSATQTFRTDTADEREILLSELEQADTDLDRADAWVDFLAGTDAERSSRTAAVAGARSTYFSAMRQARQTFKAGTGVSVRSLLREAFGN